ncbi:MAG TPA: GNAT family protein [Acidimicrobiia bacterium]|nr:GNAT family protein [Acidimicrobiia bacterium]
MHDDPTVVGAQVLLRPATVDDAPVVLEILSRPEVSQWWPGETLDSLRETLTSATEHSFLVLEDDRPVGFIQYYEELDPEYRHAGIDVALHPDVHGRGLGTDAVRTLARHLVAARGHHRLIIDPAAANARAIRCYEKVGFRVVGVMREYERGADGRFHDGLLMDLLASELDEPA